MQSKDACVFIANILARFYRTILYAEMPVKTNLRVVHSEPGVKGDTATNTLKPATLETGVEVRVPLFINEGDLIQVDTRDGSYLNRVKE